MSSFHLKLAHEPGANTNWAEMTQDAATKLLAKWNDHMQASSVRSAFPAAVSLRNITTYHLDAATGHALDRGIAVPANGAGWVGSGGASLPLEVALAVTLQGFPVGTFVADRARKRGRFYLPPLAVGSMEGTPERQGRCAPTVLGPLFTGVRDFLNDVHQMSVGQDPLNIGQTWRLVVVSRAGNFSTEVQAVRMGDVFDAQRRRRNGQPEIYTSGTITND